MKKLITISLTTVNATETKTEPKKGVVQSTKDGAKQVKSDIKTSSKSAWEGIKNVF